MDIGLLIGLINLFFAGILAGEELTVRFGVRGPLASLADKPHIEFRQALILRLRVLVPIIFGLAIFSGIATTVANGFDPAFGLRCAGLLALVSFISVTLLGTVPINAAALYWNPAALPAGWQSLVRRWERLDDVRCGAALLAFALFLLAAAL